MSQRLGNLYRMLYRELRGYVLIRAVARSMVLAVLLLAVCAGSASARVTSSPQETCRTIAIVNYAQPLREMAPIRRVPSSGRLPFAPRSIRMNVVGSAASSGAGPVGFELELWRSFAGPPLEVNWRIDTELALVNRSGSVTKTLVSRHQRVARLSDDGPGLPLFFRVERPAFYRVEVTFSDQHGRQLGQYAEYFRGLKRRVDVHLELPQRDLHPGDFLESRLENAGTTFLSYGEEFAIDRFVDGAWQQDPLTPNGFILVGFLMGGGLADICRNLKLPSDMATGHYRLRKPVRVLGGSRRELVADFHVSP
jgi:hypothetical protein